MKIKKMYQIDEAVVNDLTNDEVSYAPMTDGEFEGDAKSQIEIALDEALEASLMAGDSGNWSNVLIVGEAGIGKTAIVRSWVSKNGINLIDKKASTMDETDLGGAIAPDQEKGVVRRYGSTEFNGLDRDPVDIPDGEEFEDEDSRKEKGDLSIDSIAKGFDAMANPNQQTTSKTKKTNKSAGEEEFDMSAFYKELMKSRNTVLFLDEFNRARKNVRGTLLTLIQDHTIPDPNEPSGERYLKNFLFTIACINPNGPHFNTDQLDSAENSRFRVIYATAEPQVWLQWINKDLNNKLEKWAQVPPWVKKLNRRKNLINYLVKHKDFAFDSVVEIDKVEEMGNKLPLAPRTLTNLLYNCDGTADDFLNKWDSFCNNLDKPKIEAILKNYQDIDDKANDALKHKGGKKGAADDDEEEVFNSKSSVLDKLKDAYPEMDD